MPRGKFITDPSQFGNKYLAKFLQARVITAADFDQRTNATLSQKGNIGPDQDIFFLEMDNLDSADPGKALRHTFFMPDDSSVSKWGGFVLSAEKFGTRIVINENSGLSNLEGMHFHVMEGEKLTKKYGMVRTFEIIGLPTLEEIAARAKARSAVLDEEVAGEATTAPVSVALDKDLVLSLADGTSIAELKGNLESMEVSTEGLQVVIAQLIKEKKLEMKEKKLRVIA